MSTIQPVVGDDYVESKINGENEKVEDSTTVVPAALLTAEKMHR